MGGKTPDNFSDSDEEKSGTSDDSDDEDTSSVIVYHSDSDAGEAPSVFLDSSDSDEGKTSSIHDDFQNSDEGNTLPALMEFDFDEEYMPRIPIPDDLLDFDTEETTSVRSRIHYIFGVQDVWITFSRGLVIYNRDLIKNLKERDISPITLIADDNTFDITNPLQVSDLCDYLSSGGVKVDIVLQPSDLLFAEAFGSELFQPGDVYNKYRCPIEKSFVHIKKIHDDFFSAYSALNARKDRLYAKIFLRQLVEEDNVLLLLKNDNRIDAMKSNLRASILMGTLFEYEEKTIEINCDYVLKHLFDDLKEYIAFGRDEVRLSELIEQDKRVLLDEKRKWQQSCGILTKAELRYLKLYFSLSTEYRNLCTRADLIINDKKKQPLIQIDDKEKQSEESETPDDAHQSVSNLRPNICGDIYNFYRKHVPVRHADADIFIDPHEVKRRSVAESHSHSEFKHALFILCPPLPNGWLSQERANSWNQYTGALNDCEMRRDLINHFNGIHINEETLSVHRRDLVRSGFTEYNEKYYASAILFLKIAYLLLPTQPVLQKIMQAEKATRAHAKKTSDVNNADNSFVESLWRDITSNGGMMVHYGIVKLNLAIHRKQYPGLYLDTKSKPLLSRFKAGIFALSQSKEVDSNFKNNISSYLLHLAHDHPECADNCRIFLMDLKTRLSSSLYKEHVEAIIKKIPSSFYGNIPRITIEGLSPRSKEELDKYSLENEDRIRSLDHLTEEKMVVEDIGTFHVLKPERIRQQRRST